ncbi:MAG: excinuclease ABC subunit UvrA [bacterium]
MLDEIKIRGAREHNLKNVDLTIPRNKLVVFTGLSGSGKSSLAFDTIFAEGQRRYVESLSAYARQFLGQMQKPDVDEIEGLSPAISIDQKAHSANPRSTVATITEIYDYLRVLYARVGEPSCPQCGQAISKMTAAEMVDLILDGTRSRPAGKKKAQDILVLAPLVRGRKGEYHQLLYDLYNSGFAQVRVDGKLRSLRNRLVIDRQRRHDIDLVIDTFAPALFEGREVDADLRQRLAEAVELALGRGQGLLRFTRPDGEEKLLSSSLSCPDCGTSFPEIEPRLFSFNSPYGACQECTGLGVEQVFSDDICPACQGQRLRPEALAVRVGGKNIVELTSLSIAAAREFLVGLQLDERGREISANVMKEIVGRLEFMLNVGLHYLTLDRRAGTLSGGEAQRIRLASQIGSGLVGALYVLDEPSIGLHQKDNEQLIATLKRLRDIGNSIIVVEHDEDTMIEADWLVDFGPGAGQHGGEIVASGPVPAVFEHPESLTAKYMRGERAIPVPAKRRTKLNEMLKIVGPREHNLKGGEVEIPLRKLVCVTGVSGSGKSTLVNQILCRRLEQLFNHSRRPAGEHKALLGVEYLDRVVTVDQSPIGRTPRSNPATYTGAWTPIRELFASTEEARFRGYRPGRFSFNVPGGRCENCQGNGTLAIEMHFLPTVYVTCDVCGGKRFDRETLEVRWRDRHIHDVLELTIEEATEVFRDIPQVYDKVEVLNRVGLGYLQLGQPATTLSGGEAQRVKLASELSKRQTGRTLYVLDEPTTGLHFEDIRRLLEVLQQLVDHGNSVVVIEHNLDVIKQADYVIDLGPEGGEGGGRVVATGTPEEVAKYSDSWTAKYLKRTLKL